MRVYLSGPITNDPNYRKKFKEAEIMMKNRNCQVANPAELCSVLPKDATYEEIMNIDLEILGMCDALIQLPGWKESAGANREYGYALATDKLIVEYELLIKEMENGRMEKIG
jgi:nucleoside 2-deoxyribosyltransferase